MDYAAATPVDLKVLRMMEKYQSQEFGNPGSIHSLGVAARNAVENARKKVAGVLNCRPQEIIFTSGGTESNNLAIFGATKSWRLPFPLTTSKGNSLQGQSPASGHIITTAIEHHSVLRPCQQLEREGILVTYLSVSSDGFVNPKDVKKAIRPDTFLVSIVHANNEIGTVQSIAEIAKVIRHFRSSVVRREPDLLAHGNGGKFADKSGSRLRYPLLHIDSCQAAGALPLNVAKLGVDLMTLSGAKIYGLKGIGCLYVKDGTSITPLIYGGGQERGLRGGTEPVSLIVGFSEALVLAEKMREKKSERLTKLRDHFAEEILKIVPGLKINGYLGTKLPSELKRLPNNLNVFIPNIDNEQLVLELDAIGVAASVGSACSSGEENGSHVIWALYHDLERNRGSARFTLGRSTTKKDIDFVLKSLPEIVKRISKKFS